MAHASVELVDALRQTARRIENKSQAVADSSICKQLIQSLIGRPAAKLKLLFRKENWLHLLSDDHASAGHLVQQLQELGLSATDLQHLEHLSDPEVLAHLKPHDRSPLSSEQFAVQYLKTWARLLETQLLATLDLPVQIGHQKLAA